MSSAVFSTSAAQGRPFVFASENGAEVCPQPSGAELFGEARPPRRVASTISDLASISNAALKDARLTQVTPASRLAVRLAPEMVPSGIAEMDALTGGLPRGCLTEICGSASSGRSTLLLAALAAATRRGEFCAVVDASDALDPQSVAAAGIELDRLLWVRCGENSQHFEPCMEQLMRVADLLLESGGFGMIALDLGDIPPQNARRIPLATWFRFRRAVEYTPTVLLTIERQSIAGSCSSLLIKLGSRKLGSRELNLSDSQFPAPTHAQLLTKVQVAAELVRSRMDRKPVRSAEITFASKTAWAG
jgi:recombination protein RecA